MTSSGGRRGRAGWSHPTQGARIDLKDIYALTRTTCSGRMTNCGSILDPSSCDICPGTGCIDEPCEDATDPSTCGARLCAAETGVAGWQDRIRWAPITPSEVDGIDDPADPNDDDVPVTTVSLQTGAERYLGQRYGEQSDELEEFLTKAVSRGITTDLSQ